MTRNMATFSTNMATFSTNYNHDRFGNSENSVNCAILADFGNYEMIRMQLRRCSYG
jgi:hypothetical protein